MSPVPIVGLQAPDRDDQLLRHAEAAARRARAARRGACSISLAALDAAGADAGRDVFLEGSCGRCRAGGGRRRARSGRRRRRRSAWSITSRRTPAACASRDDRGEEAVEVAAALRSDAQARRERAKEEALRAGVRSSSGSPRFSARRGYRIAAGLVAAWLVAGKERPRRCGRQSNIRSPCRSTIWRPLSSENEAAASNEGCVSARMKRCDLAHAADILLDDAGGEILTAFRERRRADDEAVVFHRLAELLLRAVRRRAAAEQGFPERHGALRRPVGARAI